MDKYRAVEYRFDCLADRPSCDDTVFWRETGTKEDDEDVDALDTCGMIVAMAIVFRKFNIRGICWVRAVRGNPQLDTRLWWGSGRSPVQFVFCKLDDEGWRDPVSKTRNPSYPTVLSDAQWLCRTSRASTIPS